MKAIPTEMHATTVWSPLVRPTCWVLAVKIQRFRRYESLRAFRHQFLYTLPENPNINYKTGSNDSQNSKKISTVFITTDNKGRDKKEKTVDL